MTITRRILLLLVSLMCAWQAVAARKVVWVIDAGHGGHDVGCEFGYVYEKDICLAVAKEVGRLVKKDLSDVRVEFTRERDRFLSLQQRCDIANQRGAELFISIHVNSAPNPQARGTESFFATNTPTKGRQAGKSELLALLLQKYYLNNGREVSRGVKKRELYVCEHTNMTSVLTEVGFITNTADRTYINSKEGQAELARSIVQSLKEWKSLTASGMVPQRTLRDLRFAYWSPVSKVAEVVNPQAATGKAEPADSQLMADAKAQAEADAKAKAEAEAKAVAEAQAAEAEKAAMAGITVDSTLIAATPTDNASEEVKPHFAIQLMNTAKPIHDGDPRLKGFKGVRFIAAGERFKGIYSYSESYLDIKNELVEVRETFPEAFIVAFRGNQQITTAEALNALNPKQ